MEKIKANIGMRVCVPKYNHYKNKIISKSKGTIINIQKGHATVRLDKGYNETFFMKDLRYIKEEN